MKDMIESNKQKDIKDFDCAFNKIISLASDMDMVLPNAAKQSDDEMLSVEEQRKMLAVFARYVSEGHPGFADVQADNITFSDDVKNEFKEELVKCYLSTNKERSVLDMGKELFKFSKKYLPDNHFNVFSTKGVPMGMMFSPEEHSAFKSDLKEYVSHNSLDESKRGVIEHLYAERNQVGTNLFKDENIDLLIQNGAEILSDKKGETWRMTKIKHQDKDIMMIGMSSFAAINRKGELDETLIKDFVDLAKEFSKQEYKDCDTLVLDLRGNGGGWPYIGDYMARTLYGNTVSTEPLGHLKLDTLAAKLSYAYIEGKNVIDRKRLIDQEQNTQYSKRDEAWTDTYPFNPELGYSKPILVLTDQNTGSNAELTIGRLREHPCVRTIGDHSCGVVQYHPAATPKAAIPLPYGLKIALPPEGYTGANGERLEGTGYQPDFSTVGKNALLFGLNELDNITQDIAKNMPEEKAVSTSATRESRVDSVSEMNRKFIAANNPQLLGAFNELVKVTATIPQLKVQNSRAYSKNNGVDFD